MTHADILSGVSELSPREENVDAVVVGLGSLGLMLAKRLTDFGQRVVAIDNSPSVAYGPSVKNHGWLHTGVVHALSVQDQIKGRELAKKLQYGHKFFTNYAPECIDQPFDPTYAITGDSDLADNARSRWAEYGIPFDEVSKDSFISDIEPGINPDMADFFFRNDDTRVNNRLLFAKLITDIRSRGNTVLRAATYEYDDDYTISITSDGQPKVTVNSPLFFYATGPNLDETYAKLTHESLGMEYWKSHLLLLPRVTEMSVVSLDRDSPIVINHGDVSVVNRSYDEIPTMEKDYEVDEDEVVRAFERLCDFYPDAYRLKDEVQAIACLKPNIPLAADASRHSVGDTVFEPLDGHVFALPGKMTEAPYVADNLVRRAYAKLDLSMVSRRPLDTFEDRASDIAASSQLAEGA